MEYIRITMDNIDAEHVCCAMSGKQALAKKEWLKRRFDRRIDLLPQRRTRKMLHRIYPRGERVGS